MPIHRTIKNLVKNYTVVEKKVLDATSNDAWGPSFTLMSEIAELTYNAIAFDEVMQIIWKRLNDHGKNWLHVYKSLVLLDHLVKTGSERVVEQCRENLTVIQTLNDFQYTENGKDQGENVREKSKLLLELLKDHERYNGERAKALLAKERSARRTVAPGKREPEKLPNATSDHASSREGTDEELSPTLKPLEADGLQAADSQTFPILSDSNEELPVAEFAVSAKIEVTVGGQAHHSHHLDATDSGQVVKRPSLPSEVVVTPADKLKDLVPIAEGGFGIVYRATHVDWGTVAYKKLKASFIDESNRLATELVREAKMCNLRHPNIVQLIGVTFEPDNYGVILEYMSGGSLEKLLSTKVDLVIKLRIVCDIAHGVNYLHTKSPAIIHGDLKVQNVLIAEGPKGKICDFGLARWNRYSISYTDSRTKRGTVTQIPPERWLDISAPSTMKSDVYAFGILLWEVLSQEIAFKEAAERLIAHAVEKGQRPNMSAVDGPQPVSQQLKDIISNCWAQDPESRPLFGELKDLFLKMVEAETTSKTTAVDPADLRTNEVLKLKIQELQVKLVRDVRPASVMDSLFADKIITYDDLYSLKVINDHKGRREQCRELLILLHSSSHPQAFVKLRQALSKEYPWLVEELDQLCAAVTPPSSTELEQLRIGDIAEGVGRYADAFYYKRETCYTDLRYHSSRIFRMLNTPVAKASNFARIGRSKSICVVIILVKMLSL